MLAGTCKILTVDSEHCQYILGHLHKKVMIKLTGSGFIKDETRS